MKIEQPKPIIMPTQNYCSELPMAGWKKPILM